jgi:hypothetical protein
MALLLQSSDFPNFKNLSSFWVIYVTATSDSNPHNWFNVGGQVELGNKRISWFYWRK